MWNNKILLYGIDILLSIYAVYLFFYYFDIFFTRKKKKYVYTWCDSFFSMAIWNNDNS